MRKDLCHVALPEQRQGDHIVHHHQLAELAFSLFPGLTPAQEMADQFPGIIRFQQRHPQMLAKLAFWSKVL
jgi:hypothetical protein